MVARSGDTATPEKRLTAGNPVWQKSQGRGIAFGALTESIKADVVVVGAGISGALMAHALAPRYECVVVVDRRAPFHGSTSASTAMLQFEIDEPLTVLSKKLGSRNAARAWRRSFRATQDLVNLVRRERIYCGLARRDALYLAGSDMGARGLKRESKARNAAGIPGQYIDKRALRDAFGIDRAGAILSPAFASADSMSSDLDTAKSYRHHAKELRKIAADDGARSIATKLLAIADDYESMAASLEAIDKTNKQLEKKTGR